MVHCSPQACLASPPSPRPLPRYCPGLGLSLPHRCPAAKCENPAAAPPPQGFCATSSGAASNMDVPELVPGRPSADMLVPAPASHPQEGPPSHPGCSRDRKPPVEAGSPAPTAPGPEPQPQAALSRQAREEGGGERPHSSAPSSGAPPWMGPGCAGTGASQACPGPCRTGNGLEAATPWPRWQRVSKAGRLSSAPPPHQLGLRRPSSSVCGGGPAPPCPQVGTGWVGDSPHPHPFLGPLAGPPPPPAPRPGLILSPKTLDGPSSPGPLAAGI